MSTKTQEKMVITDDTFGGALEFLAKNAGIELQLKKARQVVKTYTAKYTANMTSQSGCLFFYPKTGTLYRGLAKPSYKYAVSRAKSDVATVGLLKRTNKRKEQTNG